VAESNPNPEREVQKRRSTRIVQAVPLTVTGVDALGRPFQERTSTLIVNCHGARYQSKHYVLKNMWVTLEVPHNEPGHAPRTVRGRVTWIQRPRTVRELFQIGLELEIPGNVWGIAFPPSDWFPFPEAGTPVSLEIAPPAEAREAVSADQAWSSVVESPASKLFEMEEEPIEEPAAQRVEDNVRVLPLPAGEASQQLARQMERLVADARLQLQNMVRDSATQAVAAETRPLLSALQTQLSDAAQKSVAAAVAAQIEKSQQEILQRMQQEREAGISAMRVQLSGELQSRVNETRQQLESQVAEAKRSGGADFEEQIRQQSQAAVQKLEGLTGDLQSNLEQVRAAVEQMRETSARSAGEEFRLWQEQMDLRTADSQARLAQLDQTARRLMEQITAGTAQAEVGWRRLLDSDLDAAHKRWQEKINASVEEASRHAAEQMARNSESFAREIEQQLQQRIRGLQGSQSQSVAEAENALGALRAAIQREISGGDAVISRFQESASQLDARRGEFAALAHAASEQLTRHSENLLTAHGGELNRQAESAVTGMAQRLQPMLETAGHETIEKLASELEQRLAPQIASAAEIMSRLAFDRDQAEKAVAAHQQRIFQVSDRSLQETAARGKEVLAQIESDFGESARSNSARWLGEIEARATEISHGTFESLYKSADWYEKKIQSQMQTTLEKGLEQAASRLREKAAEVSGVFASELDHYSRSYVEHARGQMQENVRDAAEHGADQLKAAGDTAAARFTERATQLASEHFEIYSSKTSAAFEQSVDQMQAHTTQIRSKLESDARAFAADFQRALTQHGQQTVSLGKEELAIQIDRAKDALAAETESLEGRFRASLNSIGASAMDEHRQRLENASNTWLLTTVTKLNQQSSSLIEELADSTEKRLKAVCGNVFAEMGETLRLRMAGLSGVFGAPPAAAPAKPIANPEEDK
jgi:hypothetical protein